MNKNLTNQQIAQSLDAQCPVINHIRRQYVTADECQPWMNYENNGNEYLIIEAVVRSKYSNIRYQHLIIGNVQNFVWSHKMILRSGNHVSTASMNLLYFTLSSNNEKE